MINPFYWYSIKSELNKYLSQIDDVDVIHVSNNLIPIPFIKLINYLVKSFPNAKLVMSFHDFYFLGRRSNYPNKKIPLISSIYCSFLKKKIDYFLAPSNYVKEILTNDLKVENHRIQKIYNSISLEELGRISVKDRKVIEIVYFGTIEIQKGIDTLCEAFLDLYCKFNHLIKLILIGRGSYFDTVKTVLSVLPSHAYSIFPWQQTTSLIQMIKNSDIFVMPTRYNETFGLGIIESYFAGLLPIGRKKGAIPEILNYDDELLFESKTELINKLRNFILEPEKIILKHNSLQDHMRNFLPSIIDSKYHNFYNKIIN
jgi:glycosyltransferase involved in cell wall biosynthesis